MMPRMANISAIILMAARNSESPPPVYDFEYLPMIYGYPRLTIEIIQYLPE
jgi:hypothetical protein